MRSSVLHHVGVCIIAFISTSVFLPSLMAQSAGDPQQGTVADIRLPSDFLKHGSSSTHLINPKASTSEIRILKVQGVNSLERDNTPIVSADGNMMFFNSTRRGDRAWAHYNPFKKRYDEDIYVAMRSAVRSNEEAWEEPVNLGSLINSSEDDGIVSISPDGQTLYFNSLKQGWEKDGGPFYTTRLRGRNWSDVEGLGGGITKFFADRAPGFSFRVYGGSISSDGRDFYFATTLYSSTNKHQIWVSHFNNGTWSYPENLGPAINDGTGSYAPFIAADSKTLYFSAGFAGGFGGDDLYVTTLGNGVWSAPVNLGAPINNSEHNAFLSLPASGNKIYYAITASGDEDIYVADLPEVNRPAEVALLAGLISDKQTGMPLEATVQIEDLQTGTKIFEANSNSADGIYTAVLQAGRDYGISINAPGYVFHSERYTIPEDINYKEFKFDVKLDKLHRGVNFTANNIFFDYNTATLSPESKLELERVTSLMREHDALEIEIGGHTDNVGSADYNYNLSMQRAEAVRDYLVNAGGIDSVRISVKGYGFDKPVAPNKTEQGRNRNRRSEFTVTSM